MNGKVVERMIHLNGGMLGIDRETKKKRRELGLGSRLLFGLGAYLPHPEQDAQHSAEGQHAALAALTAPVRPNATTANNKIALMVFMTFSFFGMKGCCDTDRAST